jgi:hypothetical protein
MAISDPERNPSRSKKIRIVTPKSQEAHGTLSHQRTERLAEKL